MEPIVRSITVNGTSLAFWEWRPDTVENPPLLFAHATGFHGRVFDAVIERFPNRRVVSLDMRGHGRSEGDPIDHWHTLADDVAAIIDHLGIVGAVGIGHSMGGHTLAQTAHDRPAAFSRLVLFDPVILAPEFYTPSDPLFSTDTPHPAIRRKRDFASPDAMMQRFADRDPYNLFDAQVFADYCRYGLQPRNDGGGMELACPPEVEASVYSSSRSNAGIHDAVRRLDIPVLIVRAKQSDIQDFKGSPTWPELAAIMRHGTDMYRPDMTHFHPFQDPSDAARIIAEAIAG